jgi:hypothetical protein
MYSHLYFWQWVFKKNIAFFAAWFSQEKGTKDSGQRMKRSNQTDE